MMLEYAKAVQESVYEQLRVVREGHLRIIFTSDLKILSWEFCARRHEELLPRRLVAPQVNQLLEVVQKCHSTLTEMPNSQQDLLANINMVVTTGRQLAKSLEFQSLIDSGFSKSYVRYLQTAEVVNSMKDLMDICMEHKAGPIEGLKSIPRYGKAAKFETQNIQETEQQMGCIHGLPTDRNALDKFMSLHPGLNSQISNNQHIGGRGALSGSGQASLALSNLPVTAVSSTNLQLQQQQLLSSGLLPQNQSQSSQGSQVLQQQMIQQHLQYMNTSSGGCGVQQQCLAGQSGGGSALRQGLALGNYASMTAASTSHGPGSSVGPTPSRIIHSFESPSYFEPSASVGNSGFSDKTPGLPPSMHVSDEMVPDTSHEFTENDFLNSDLDHNMSYGWKA